jgi:DNA-binding GntR family transcriptional regulator
VAEEMHRDLIVQGTLAPGERLNEAALAERLRISRSPIREALRALSGQHLALTELRSSRTPAPT